MSSVFRIILAGVVFMGFVSVERAQLPVQSETARIRGWREDLQFFAASMRGTPIEGQKPLPGQKDLAKIFPRFDADIAALEADLPRLGDGAIAWRLSRIMASMHIAHNAVGVRDSEVLPFSFEWIDGGLAVLTTTEEFRKFAGHRVVQMGDLPAETILASASPYLSYETEGWRRHIGGGAMRSRSLLELLGVVENGRVRLTFDGPGGATVADVPFVPVTSKLIAWTASLGLPALLVNRHPEQAYYWREFLAASQTMYVQYRQCADDPALKFAAFAEQTLQEIDSRKPRRVIVDVRFNAGGNQAVIKPLVRGLAARRKAIGVPYVLMGAGTFSSGVRAVTALRDQARARLVGEPTGGQIGGYGESPSRKLPYSGMGMQWTIKLFPKPEPVRPDLAVPFTFEDLRAGRDPALDAAIREGI